MICNLPKLQKSLEKYFIETAIEQSGGNRERAAALLGLKRTTLVEKMKRHQMLKVKEKRKYFKEEDYYTRSIEVRR